MSRTLDLTRGLALQWRQRGLRAALLEVRAAPQHSTPHALAKAKGGACRNATLVALLRSVLGSRLVASPSIPSFRTKAPRRLRRVPLACLCQKLVRADKSACDRLKSSNRSPRAFNVNYRMALRIRFGVRGTCPVQWYLTQPLCSWLQHQSFLESDQPCIQLENPAAQS